jgi:RecJ-like exonuclease
MVSIGGQVQENNPVLKKTIDSLNVILDEACAIRARLEQISERTFGPPPDQVDKAAPEQPRELYAAETIERLVANICAVASQIRSFVNDMERIA